MPTSRCGSRLASIRLPFALPSRSIFGGVAIAARDDADDRDKTTATVGIRRLLRARHRGCLLDTQNMGRRASIMPVVRRPQIRQRIEEVESQGEASPKRLGPHQGRHDGSSHPAGQGLNSRRRRLPNMQSSIRSHNRRRASVRRFRNTGRRQRKYLWPTLAWTLPTPRRPHAWPYVRPRPNQQGLFQADMLEPSRPSASGAA